MTVRPMSGTLAFIFIDSGYTFRCQFEINRAFICDKITVRRFGFSQFIITVGDIEECCPAVLISGRLDRIPCTQILYTDFVEIQPVQRELSVLQLDRIIQLVNFDHFDIGRILSVVCCQYAGIITAQTSYIIGRIRNRIISWNRFFQNGIYASAAVVGGGQFGTAFRKQSVRIGKAELL